MKQGQKYFERKRPWNSKHFIGLSLTAASLMYGSIVSAQDLIVDFTNSRAYGLDATTIMVENVRVDTSTANPNDPSRPEINSDYYNIPWRFDISTASLIPNLESVISVNEDSSCATLDVYVTNAFTGSAMANAQVEVGGMYSTTDSTGVATFTNMVAGPAQIESNAVGFVGTDRQVVLSCDAGVSVGLSLNPQSGEGALAADEVRIILSWGENPRDLDSHLTGPSSSSDGSSTDADNRIHVYFSARDGDVADLDTDDTSSYGPETITISPFAAGQNLRQGLYRYSVYHYAGTSDITHSNASVRLQYGSVSRTFTPPSGASGENDLWTVFEFYVDANGGITVYDVNTIDTSFGGGSSSVPLIYLPYGELETGIDFDSLPPK